MKVGMRNLYLDTMGGGERYFLTAAEFFLKKGDDVTIFWNNAVSLTEIKRRYDIDLTGVKFSEDIFGTAVSALDKLVTTSEYDLLFFLSDGSIPSSLARKNILHFQFPLPDLQGQTLINKLKLTRFQNVICNSEFTKRYVDFTFGIVSKVIYPPVDIDKFSPGRKEKIILSVGRFAPTLPKKQAVLIEAFKKIYPKISGWRLVLLGGITLGDGSGVDELRDQARGFPIQIIPDVSFVDLQKHYSLATFYWHAAGFGENLKEHPERAEHFGITTVEAMAGGCVPIVFAAGGQIEIVREGETGFLWVTEEELAEKTLNLIMDKAKTNKISQSARERAGYFSKDRFFSDLAKITS